MALVMLHIIAHLNSRMHELFSEQILNSFSNDITLCTAHMYLEEKVGKNRSLDDQQTPVTSCTITNLTLEGLELHGGSNL